MAKLLLLLFSIVLICYQTNFSSAGRCFDGERQALIKVKKGLIDPSNRLSSWIGENCCIWDGITCNNQTGHVEMLHLRNPITPYRDLYTHYWYSYSDNSDIYSHNCLSGEISPSILNLHYLRYLDLSHNSFGVQIPSFFGSFKNLRYLNLSSAKFVGEIPPHLGNLTNLEYLDLGPSPIYEGFTDNLLTAKSLQWITKLTSLKALNLSGTDLNQSLDWFDSINMLPSLSSLALWNCQLVGKVYLPLSNSFNLTSLVSLDMRLNYYLDSASLFKLFNLTSKLEILRIEGNNFEDPVLSMLKKFTSLSVLDFSSNSFSSSGVLDLLCNLTSLVYIDLSWNQLNGSLPLCLGNLTSLKEVYLQGNKLGGEIPGELGHLKQLVALDLSYNSFNSSVPSSFGKLSKLKYLTLAHNQLSGKFPLTLGQISELQLLDVSRNLLTGEIFESPFMKLKSLKYLYVSNNQFLTFNVNSQQIPLSELRELEMGSIQMGTQFLPWLRNQKNIAVLSMENCSISSTINEFFKTVSSSVKTLLLSSNKIHGSLTSIPSNVVNLDLSNNLLTGIFPANCTINSLLTSLSLDNNQLTGSLPICLCNLSSLGILSLSNNQLTGRIPPCIGNLRELRVLNLANNSLSGHIPNVLSNLEYLLFLHLGSNKLHGVVPSSLKNLKILRTLDLGGNQLSGALHNWIGQEFSQLKFLRLESNNFSGNICVHLCQLSSLQVLNLDHNSLAGHIPYCFGNLSKLRANNKLIGGFGFFTYTEELQNNIKGITQEYSSNLWGLKSISLSGNKLEGEIPEELMDLDGLQSLNLSKNNLSGRIPKNIGKLKQLESLDLAMNQLFGPLPPGLANIDTLSFLNLSFNHLSGAIPPGDHFQTLMTDPSVSEGNSGLCGKPLGVTCPHEPTEGKVAFRQKIDEKFENSWFYAGVGPGFAVGLVGVLCLLLFKKSWRHAYFRFWENSFDRMWVFYCCEDFLVQTEIQLSIY